MKLFKRCLVFALVCAMLSCTLCVFAAGTPSYTLSTGNAEVGGTFEMTLGIKNNPGIVAARVRISYDASAVTLVSVRDAGLLKGYVTPSPTVSSPYTLFWKESEAKTNNTSNGAIAVLTFRVNSGVRYTDKSVKVSTVDAFTKDLTPVVFTGCEAGVNIVPLHYTCPYSDVRTGDWFYSAVAYTDNRGLFQGVGGNLYAPNGKMTRAMLVAVLWRIEGEPGATALPFSDVPAGTWYTKAVAWANSKGIVSGVGNGLFAPQDPVTREQIATILLSYAEYKGAPHGQIGQIGAYSDFSSISGWAREAMIFAVGAGIIKGTSTLKLSPLGEASRAEVAAMLMRYLELVAR